MLVLTTPAPRVRPEVPADTFPLVYDLWVHLADNEWGNRLMDVVAAEALDDPAHRDKIVVVSVIEHGGWSMTYARLGDGRIGTFCTANDQGVPSREGGKFLRRQFYSARERLGCVRRNNTRVCFGTLAVGERFMDGEHVWTKTGPEAARNDPHYAGDEREKRYAADTPVNRVK